MLKTKDGKELDVEILTWEQARSTLVNLDTELVRIIDKISPGKDFKFYKARYPFGTKILDKNVAYLPLQNGETISFNSKLLPDCLIRDLSFDFAKSNPVGIITDKHSEFFVSVNNGILPYAVVSPGDIFGTARILDTADNNFSILPHSSFSRWELSSGARSIFMLSRITESISHSKLKKMYKIFHDKPNTYQKHWSIFHEIAIKHQKYWNSEILFFSNNWFAHLNDLPWVEFYCYLLRENRRSYKFGHNLISWQITFNAIEQSKKLKYYPFSLNTARHLFSIAAGSFPGFSPAINEDSAPIKILQEAYSVGYGLKEKSPIIMVPSHFSLNNGTPVYYSVNYPTLIQCNPQTFKGKSLITLLDQVQRITEKYQGTIGEDELARATSLYGISNAIKFTFYHNNFNSSEYKRILNNNLISEEDPRFTCEAKHFPNYSQFLKGCVKISLSK